MEVQIGRITHYYDHLNVAVLQLTDRLKVGETIHVLGHTTDFLQKVTSMEVDHRKVVVVEPGDDVALKVDEAVREHDMVYRVTKDVLDLQAL
jgi:putative protease